MVNHMDQWLHVGPQKLPEGDGWGGGAVKRAVLCLFFVQAGGASPSRPVAQVIVDGRTLPAQDSALEFGVTFGAVKLGSGNSNGLFNFK